MIRRVISSALFRANSRLFRYQCRAILKTPPIQTDNSPLVVLSLVSHKDLVQYLCAVKTLWCFMAHGRIAIINDGSFTTRDTQLLEYHISSPLLLNASKISTGRMPSGNCWERLVCALELSQDAYVIQLDSDTLTLAAIPEVQEAITANRGFTLNSGSSIGKAIFPMKIISEKVKTFSPSQHVQSLAERNFERLQGYAWLNYVRGSASFAGFARGAVSCNQVENISMEMQSILGSPKWREWGSEQVMSNIAIANSPGAFVLPWPRYASFYPAKLPFRESAFLHFIGTHRFENRIYLKLAQGAIDELNNPRSAHAKKIDV